MARTAFVEQSGRITPTHIAKWVTDGVITDGGTITTLNAILVSGEIISISTRVVATATNIAVTVNAIQTYGYYTLGDGGDAFYTRTTAFTLGGFQSADGAWWKLVIVNVINARWFGAKGDDTTDDTAALQAMFNLLPNTLGTREYGSHPLLYVPAGIYKVTSTIAPANSLSNYKIQGAGTASTVIKWEGASDGTVIKLVNAREVLFDSFAVFGNVATPPKYCIEVNKASGLVGTAAPSSCTFSHMFVGGPTGGMAKNGITYTNELGFDDNNDQANIIECHFINCTEAGVRFESTNALFNALHMCDFGSCGVAVSNIAGANAVIPAAGGGFNATMCRSGLCGKTFELGPSQHSINIEEWASEADDVFFYTPSTVGTSPPLVLSFVGCSHVGLGAPNQGISVFDAGSESILDIVACELINIKFSFPTTGSLVNIIGGTSSIANIDYNNLVTIENHLAQSGNLVSSNLGSGTLNAYQHGAGSNQVDVIPQIAAATTLDINGLSSNLIFLNFAAPTTLSTITGGTIGQEITLNPITANVTIGHGTGASQIRLNGGADYVMPNHSTLTIRRGDASIGDGWVEVSRTGANS